MFKLWILHLSEVLWLLYILFMALVLTLQHRQFKNNQLFSKCDFSQQCKFLKYSFILVTLDILWLYSSNIPIFYWNVMTFFFVTFRPFLKIFGLHSRSFSSFIFSICGLEAPQASMPNNGPGSTKGQYILNCEDLLAPYSRPDKQQSMLFTFLHFCFHLYAVSM